MLNLNVSLSQQRVIAIRHGIVELHPELQALRAVSLVQHYTALNQHCAVLHTGSVQHYTAFNQHCAVLHTRSVQNIIILHSTNTVPCYIQGPYRTSLYCTQPTLCRVTYTVRTEHHRWFSKTFQDPVWRVKVLVFFKNTVNVIFTAHC